MAPAMSHWAGAALFPVLASCSATSSSPLETHGIAVDAGDGITSGSASDASGFGHEADAAALPDTLASFGLGDAGDSAPPFGMDADATGAVDAASPGDAGLPAVRFVARVDRTDPARPRFAWSGSTMLARFVGASVGVRLTGPATYFDVFIDGVLQPAPLVTSPTGQDYPLKSNLAPGPHELTLYRRNEAMYGGSGDTAFLGLILDPAGALLPPSAPSARRLEIVGDSTTTGYGDEGKSQSCPFSLATQNYDLAYGSVAARSLGADLITIAWSAKGMVRNYAGDTTQTMPVLYGRTLPDQTSDTWDFGTWIPHAVLINLGSNDFQQGDPGQPYVTTYTAFVRRIRQNYPSALIVCAVGPKLVDPQLSRARTYVMGIVSAMNASGDKLVDFLELPQAMPADGYGCGGHASIATHKRMGDVLAAELKSKLGW